MLSELDESLRRLLTTRGGLDPAEIDIRFEIPDRDWAAGIARPSVNCYLYDIHENRQLRNPGWTVEPDGRNGARKRRAPWRIDLSYLITAWTKAVEDEHRLLWQVLATLFQHPLFPTEALQGVLAETDMPIPTLVAQQETALRSPGEFWSALENKLKPSINYVVTLPLDPEALVTAPLTFSFELRSVNQVNGLPAGTTNITGVVRDATGQVIPTARVFFVGANASLVPPSATAAAGSGAGRTGQDRPRGISRSGSGLNQSMVTDCDGSFTFEALRPGRYRVAIVIPDQPPRERELVVPSDSYDLTVGDDA